MTDKTQLVDIETNTEKKETRGRKPKFSSEEERHLSILKSKRDYYRRNADLYKLKALHYYYCNQLKRDDLDENKKEKYEKKLRQIVEKINILVNFPDSTESSELSESSQSSSD